MATSVKEVVALQEHLAVQPRCNLQRLKMLIGSTCCVKHKTDCESQDVREVGWVLTMTLPSYGSRSGTLSTVIIRFEVP